MPCFTSEHTSVLWLPLTHNRTRLHLDFPTELHNHSFMADVLILETSRWKHGLGSSRTKGDGWELVTWRSVQQENQAHMLPFPLM
jgi:hypothetical protein